MTKPTKARLGPKVPATDDRQAQARRILNQLNDAGLRIWIEWDCFRIAGPPGALTEELHALIRANRIALILELLVKQDADNRECYGARYAEPQRWSRH